MTTEPKMFITSSINCEFEKEVLKKCVSRTYRIGKDSQTYLLTPLRFNPKVKRLNAFCKLAGSEVIKGDYIRSLLQYSPNSMMICGNKKAMVVAADTMNQLKVVNINTVDPTYRKTPPLSAHMIPGT